MEAHKRILGIIYIISGAFQILIMLFLSAFISTLFPLIFENAEVDERWVLVWVVPFINAISVTIILFFAIPSIVGGWGLLNKKKWALTLVLILGCFNLFSFPIGTAIGIYTIWVYTEDNRVVQQA